jgi:sucrose-6-phosphate hydrolase SacC (GH32 family)
MAWFWIRELREAGMMAWWDFLLCFETLMALSRCYMQVRSTSLQIYQIGLATSTDGINWTRYSGNPILQPGSSGAWDEKQVLDPSLVIDLDAPPEERYKMWYNGY